MPAIEIRARHSTLAAGALSRIMIQSRHMMLQHRMPGIFFCFFYSAVSFLVPSITFMSLATRVKLSTCILIAAPTTLVALTTPISFIYFHACSKSSARGAGGMYGKKKLRFPDHSQSAARQTARGTRNTHVAHDAHAACGAHNARKFFPDHVECP